MLVGRPGLTALLSMAGFWTQGLCLLDSQAFSAFPDHWYHARPHPLSRDFRHRNVAALPRSPLFPIGSPGLVFGRAPILWILAAGIATYTAYRYGAFGPHSMEWRVNTFISDPMEAPFAEEFGFRGVILTALNATSLGSGYGWERSCRPSLFRRIIWSHYSAACRWRKRHYSSRVRFCRASSSGISTSERGTYGTAYSSTH
jgi:hypothetical protein